MYGVLKTYGVMMYSYISSVYRPFLYGDSPVDERKPNLPCQVIMDGSFIIDSIEYLWFYRRNVNVRRTTSR